MAVKAQSISLISDRAIAIRKMALVFTGSYTTGGDTLDLTAIDQSVSRVDAFPNFTLGGIKTTYELACSGGYYTEIVRGSALNNWKVKVYAPAGTELPASAYPGAVTTTPQFDSFTFAIESKLGK